MTETKYPWGRGLSHLVALEKTADYFIAFAKPKWFSTSFKVRIIILFKMNNKLIIKSPFVHNLPMFRSQSVLSASADSTLLDLQNSPNHTQPHPNN